MLKIKKREVTLNDFLKMKKFKPWSTWRQMGKTINFSLLFGCSAMTFASMLDQNGFTVEDADELILEAKLDSKLREKMDDPKCFSKGPKFCKLLVCSEFMKDNFFQLYKGLETRLEREVEFAREHGYTRAWNGPMRHVPEFLLLNFSDRGFLRGNDKVLYSKMASSIKNVVGNTTIQTLEAAIVFPAIHEICSYIRNWKLKSFIFNTIHDSIDLCVFIPEEELILSLVNQCMTKFRYFDHGVPMESDADLVDLMDIGNQYYKHGKDAKPINIDIALKNYNEKNGTNFEYDIKKYL